MIWLRLLMAIAALSAPLVACSGTPTFPPVDRDRYRECAQGAASPTDGGMDGSTAGATACPAGQVCLQGRCYETCTSDAQCGPGESCGSGGACTPTGGPRPDTGPAPDTGVDRCRGVSCGGGQVCSPRTGDCVECIDSTMCGGLRQICDRARGRCVAFDPAQCAPCNSDLDCIAAGDAGAGFSGRCGERVVRGSTERVCAVECGSGGACPNGLDCDTDLNLCFPMLYDCTNWYAAATDRVCAADADCAPIGATGADLLVLGSCGGLPPAGDAGGADASADGGDGAVGDAGGGATGICRFGCGMDIDCPGGETCQPPTGMGFCVAP